MAPARSDEEITKILLEHRYLLSADAICAKWKITRNRLREWKKAHPYVCATPAQLVVVALLGDDCVKNGLEDPGTLTSFLDWLNHAVYSDEEIRSMLAELVEDGLAVERDGRWFYNQEHSANGTSFIF